jgi:hypothetical protein
VVFLALGCIALAGTVLCHGTFLASRGCRRSRARRYGATSGPAAGPLAGGFLFPLLPALIICASAATLFAAASLGLVRPAARQS